MNAEIDKLLSESGDLSVGLIALLRSPHLNDCRFALQELARGLDGRIAKMMELRSEEDEAEQKPKLSPVP